jgi:hypothetical protein
LPWIFDAASDQRLASSTHYGQQHGLCPQLPQHGTWPIFQVVSHFDASYSSLSSTLTQRTVPQRVGGAHSGQPAHAAQSPMALPHCEPWQFPE